MEPTKNIIYIRRKDEHRPLKEYQIVVVIYGNASAPHCAVRAMIEGAKAFEDQYPRAVVAVRNDFYVDDVLSGAQNIEEAIKLAKDMRFVLQESGFLLCKWKSNYEQWVQELEDGSDVEDVLLSEESMTSVLGLKWLIHSDEFTYVIKNEELPGQTTKRNILSRIAKLYDPNGFIAPVITKAIILMQTMWANHLDWDTEVPNDIKKEWIELWSQINV